MVAKAINCFIIGFFLLDDCEQEKYININIVIVTLTRP